MKDEFDPADFIAAEEDPLGGEVDLTEAPICAGCGCSQFDPCPGGCIWATANLCSRCV